MKRKLWITFALIVSVALVGASYAGKIVYIPLVVDGNEAMHVASVTPYADAPACATHDPTAYHGLWNEVDGCHADHTHNVDPHGAAITAIFGDYTQYTGQEVSYPWQTFAGAAPGLAAPPADPAYENDFKHNGTKFDFYDFSAASYGCPVAAQGVKAVPKAWLIERHSLGNKHDYMARVHSVWAMVKFCIPGTSEWAYLYTGGWQDFGQRTSPYKEHVVPIPGNPVPAYDPNLAPYLSHHCINHPDCPSNPNLANLAWISTVHKNVLVGHRLFGFGIRSNDSHQKLDATNGFNQPDPPFVYMCADAQGNYVQAGCKFNHSAGHTYAIIYEIPAELDLLDGVDDDRVNYEGYTNRWGEIVQGCTAIALDCVPVYMDNLPVGKYHANIVQYGLTSINTMPDYDWCHDAAGATVDCATAGAIPSGWIGSSN